MSTSGDNDPTTGASNPLDLDEPHKPPPEQFAPLSLLDLPVELLDHLSEYLDYPTLTSLRWTCRALHNILDVPPLENAQSERVQYLLNVERWPLYANLWTCTRCARLRPARKFTSGMIQHKRAKGASSAKKRVCGECGVQKGIYEKGNLLRFGGNHASPSSPTLSSTPPGHTSTSKIEWGIVCKRCGTLKMVDKDSTAALRRKCDECMEYRPPGSVWQRSIIVSAGVKAMTSDEHRSQQFRMFPPRRTLPIEEIHPSVAPRDET